MAIKGTIFKVDDNSGAKTAQVIGIPGNSVVRQINVGDRVKVAVKKVLPNGPIKSGEVHTAIVTRLRKGTRRPDGSIAKADANGLVLVNQKGDMIGSAVLTIVDRKIGQMYQKIASVAKGGVY